MRTVQAKWTGHVHRRMLGAAIGGGALTFFVITMMIDRQSEAVRQIVENAYHVLFVEAARLDNLSIDRIDDARLRQRAADVSRDVKAHILEAYGSLDNLPSNDQLVLDEGFQRASLQFVVTPRDPAVSIQAADERRIPYTVVYTRDFTMVTHTQERLRGRNVSHLQERDELYLFWWRIFGRAVIDNQEKTGYYLWPEADGSVALKYMLCTPIAGTRLMVAVTNYPHILNADMLVKNARDMSKALRSTESTLRWQGRMVSAVLFLCACFLGWYLSTLILAELRFAESKVARSHRLMELTGLDTRFQEVFHQIKNDLFVIQRRAILSLRDLHRFELRAGPEAMESSFHKEWREALTLIQQRSNVIRKMLTDNVHERRLNAEPQFVDLISAVEDAIRRQNVGDGVKIRLTQPLVGRMTRRRIGARVVPIDLHDILDNVIKNAIQAVGESGLVEIVIERDGPAWRRTAKLTCRDTGSGFENIDKAMWRGYTTKQSHGGSGLGLSIVERNVLACDGFIRLRNGGGRWGAVVEIWLPMSTQSSERPPHDPEAARPMAAV
jgi:signal transduction histidine kinase